MRHHVLPALIHAATLFVLAGSLSADPSSPKDLAVTSCILCHGDTDLFEADRLEILRDFERGIHAAVGLSCHDCHGGNPDPALAEEMFEAMDESWDAAPYRGVPARPEIAALCGGCHSDPDYMKRFAPRVRVDQESEYHSSGHGRAMAEGRTSAATCVDCHGVHGILGVSAAEAAVYPTRVAETCNRCHGDPERMAGVVLPDGRPVPTDVYPLWRRSVHAAALHERGDLTAPTCNDCHGNHGAAPPGVDSISFVCGQCHGREAELFRRSAKHELYPNHNVYLADAGDDGCAACHAAPEPQAELTEVRRFTECDTCHSHHAVLRPTVAMLGNLPPTPCAFCHESTALTAEEDEKVLAGYAETRDRLIAASGGLEGDALFDHLVDEALRLSFHTLTGPEGEEPRTRPEFQRLFDKFRIGKARHAVSTPEGEIEVKVRSCTDCHGAEAAMGEPVGYTVARTMLDGMHELGALTAQSERLVLRAKRGGLEVRGALGEIENAVDAQIGLEVLVHSFDAGEGGAFQKKQAEGMESARAALTQGHEALEELKYRRRGLMLALLCVLLVAGALAYKIRDLAGGE